MSPRFGKLANSFLSQSKTGKDPGFIESYRPVCLLACLGKFVDRIVMTRLDFVVEAKEILPNSQAGFRKGRTTKDPLLDLINDIHNLRAHIETGVDKSPITLLLLDLKKAFERVDPWILLRLVHRLGIPPCLVKWYRSFLITECKSQIRLLGIKMGETRSRGPTRLDLWSFTCFSPYISRR